MAEFCQMIGSIISERSTAQWIELLESAEIPVARLNSMEDLYTDPHLQDVGFFKSLDDPYDGRLKLPGFPLKFSKTPANFSRAGPMLGEHTAEVLGELGMSKVEIDTLVSIGAVQIWHGKDSS